METISRARQNLDMMSLLFSVSQARWLNDVEREALERFCSTLCDDMSARPICRRALFGFARKVRESGLTECGHAIDVEPLLARAEILKLMVTKGV